MRSSFTAANALTTLRPSTAARELLVGGSIFVVVILLGVLLIPVTSGVPV